MNAFSIILSGGSGTRLWPVSRELYPKQLIPLFGERSLLQETVDRCTGIEGLDGHIVVCNQEHRFMIAEQLRASEVTAASILLEPAARNTAPAVAVAALQAQSLAGESDVVVLVLPSDHRIGDVAAFRSSADQAITLAGEGHLVTFGIKPSQASTGYGYIEAAEPIDARSFRVAGFTEKPDLATARRYIESGRHFWNSGMFAFRADRYLEELWEHRPDIAEACQASFAARYGDLDFCRVGDEAFSKCPSESIDYAVMEKTRHGVMIPIDVGWSDVGSWDAIMAEAEPDEDGNVLEGDVSVVGCRDVYVRSPDRFAAAVGVEDLLIVDSPDALLVTTRSRAQDVKEIVSRLRSAGRPEAVQHRRVYRPWGSYESIASGPRFQVKRIIVNPGERLSLQMHHHRSEHWIVVAGTATVVRGDDEFQLTENESTFIPIGTRHRLANPGRLALELIEVQSGAYLGEDDIVRFEDGYGRVQGTSSSGDGDEVA